MTVAHRTSHIVPPLIDRLLAPLGARALVADRPRMGWLLTEIAPAMLWTSLTGALWLDGYNLVLYLTLLGAGVADLAWLPLVNYAGIALHVLIVALRPPRGHAKATCVAYTAAGRAAWLGTILWPLLAWRLGLGTGWVLGGVFASILITAMVHNVGIAGFMTWTQAVVPPEQRGRFYMWRNLFGFGAVNLALQGVALAWPVAADPHATADPAQLPWLMGLMAAATLLVLAGTLPLAWGPDMPEREAAAPPSRPLAEALRGQHAFHRLVAMGACNTAAQACVLPYLPRLLQHVGLDGRRYAALQGDLLIPLLLAGTVVAGMLLRRIGGARLIGLMLAVSVLGESLFLLLDADNVAWLAPCCLAAAGLGRGLASIAWIGRVQELAPAHDTRFPMVHIAANGMAGMLLGGTLMAVVPWLEALHARGTLAPEPVWLVVAAGVALRLATLVLALWPRSRQAAGPRG
jgi:hypothetical protein